MQRQQDRMLQRNRQREQAMTDLLAQPGVGAALVPLNAMNLTIVSSLPRGGGATLMAMLEAGGAKLLKDEGQGFQWSSAPRQARQPGGSVGVENGYFQSGFVSRSLVYRRVVPPLGERICPVSAIAGSLSRNATAAAWSSGRLMRCIGESLA